MNFYQVVAEGQSTGHGHTMAKLRGLEELGDVVRITVRSLSPISKSLCTRFIFHPRRCITCQILRHPISRILSRYWFEGRWQLFAKSRSEDEAMSLHMWLARDHCSPDSVSSKAKAGRLWNCMANYYVKTFAGWTGRSLCDSASAEGCSGGVGPLQLAEAKDTLATRFDVVLITEWLSSRPQVL